MPLWASGRERGALITVYQLGWAEGAGAADKTLISTSVGMPLVVRSVTAFSFVTTRNGTAMIPDSNNETDGYLEEVRHIQPASILRQLSPGEGARGMSSVASARLILQQVWIRRRRRISLAHATDDVP